MFFNNEIKKIYLNDMVIFDRFFLLILESKIKGRPFERSGKLSYLFYIKFNGNKTVGRSINRISKRYPKKFDKN